jgi:hypothetical protein
MTVKRVQVPQNVTAEKTKPIWLVVSTANSRGARRLIIKQKGKDKTEAQFYSDPAKAVVFALLLQQEKISYKRGEGMIVPVPPRLLDLLIAFAETPVRWQTLVREHLIPNPTVEKLAAFLYINKLIKESGKR